MISVCLATYNGAKYIQTQLNSILIQLGENDEVIISDDGSSDDTLQIINEFNDSRIKFAPTPSPTSLKGIYKEFSIIHRVSNNFLNAIQMAQGDTIYLSDQDDVWLKNKISICEEKLKSYDIVVHRRQDVNRVLEPIVGNLGEDDRIASLWQCLKVSHFQGACMGFTKRIKGLIVENSQLFHNNPLSHDHAIGLMCLAFYGAKHVSFETTQLILYRRHGNNVSSTGEKSTHSLLFKLLYRYLDLKLYFTCKILKFKRTLRKRYKR